jgi:hypothetical protein
MKLEKRSGKYSGYCIDLIIGGRKYESYWDSPPTSVDHVGLEYANGRYPVIATKKRLREFKDLYKNLWIEVTEYQFKLMQHCIGISKNKRPYRNFFFTQENDTNWNQLAEKGLAIKGIEHPNNDEYIYFWLSKQGVEFVLKKSISDEVYKKL